ncbi:MULTISPECIES: 1,2-phenylacetyl-CoA epoxidase subunit PaaC [unclassified Ruegeria]|uniref:1,2-phenylacetyl-CoA epoxidase subunit PaaC n=1 Tax=unclassified Ruegeria TaxID=2625375 RepID=UPI001ADB5E4F|nr:MULTISPECIES: 1,2-phenylacetyl-CoA epoxidase subunit PaaC [unclassified Ruegeria]MBO9413643.1 phenylacetate-CoA oxygenase subunit PaaC [Ruegeria sp. R8_1]MBO9417629.1 phenylacetate-CoA oxygenase subunit PaaC [Ruegeria sp. R8_2]
MDAAQKPLLEFLLRQGDNALVLGHRTSEWCGVAPILEEDIALANMALDQIGQTQLWLGYAAEVEGAGRSADDLAFLRDVYDFRNLLMLEVPNGDFGRTQMRQFLYDAFQVPWLTQLQNSTDTRVGEIASKCLKEALYHLDRSSHTVIALGDGTAESNKRMDEALTFLWPYSGEVFVDDETDHAMATAGVAPLPSEIKPLWLETVQTVLAQACLTLPEGDYAQKGGRTGFRHTEHLGHMLAVMQTLQRSYPGATW